MVTVYAKKLLGPLLDKRTDKGQDNETCQLIEKSAQYNGKKITVMLDSGATGNFISEKLVRLRKLPIRNKNEPYSISNADNGDNSYNNGWVTEETQKQPLLIGTHLEDISFDITDIGNHDIILGRPWFKKHNPSVDWETEELNFNRCLCQHEPRWKHQIKLITRKQIKAIARKGKQLLHSLTWWKTNDQSLPIPTQYKKFAKVFAKPSDVGLPEHKPWDHEIPLQEGKQPTFKPIYKCSAEELNALREYIDENLRKGLIRESHSPAGYPILFVPKKNGTLRLCVDYRQLNDITIKDRMPLPRIDEMFDRIQGAEWFSKFDLIAAYARIRIKEGEEWKTAFRTRFGHYEYLVMPFGLTNAPASFQRFINNVLRHLLDKGVIVYLDDILIYSKTEEEHSQLITEVLKALQENDLFVELEKSEFHKTEVEFLGHIVGINGIRMDPAKVSAVLDWPTPRNIKDVQSFTGFCNYYRRFIKDYSKKATPLHRFTKKGIPFKWDEQAEEAFQDIKRRIAEQPILKTFDPNKETFVETDASDYAIGATLYQKHEGCKHPIAFLSKKLTDVETRYPIHDKELFAIVEACRQWRSYLQGNKFPIQVFTDHKNLTWFFYHKRARTATHEVVGRIVII
jgi:hypothetical protein